MYFEFKLITGNYLRYTYFFCSNSMFSSSVSIVLTIWPSQQHPSVPSVIVWHSPGITRVELYSQQPHPPWYLVVLSHWAGLPSTQVLADQLAFSSTVVPAGSQDSWSRQQLPAM